MDEMTNMQNFVPYLSAISTILGIVFFLGIVWWAWSAKQQVANEESAQLPFELPDEFSKE
jgi:cytochrome c oxidase cbb3-type subunit 4